MVDSLDKLRKQQGVTPQKIDIQPQPTEGAEQKPLLQFSEEEQTEQTLISTQQDETLAAESRENRAEAQREKTVEVEIKAEICKMLQDKGEEANADNFLAKARELLKDLEKKKIIGPLSPQEQEKYDTLAEICKNDSIQQIKKASQTNIPEDANSEPIVNFEDFIEGKYKDKKPEDLASAYLKKHDPDFKNLSPEEAKNRIKETLSTLNKIVSNGKRTSFENATVGDGKKVAELLIAMDSENIKISDIKNLKGEEVKHILDEHEKRVLKTLFEMYTPTPTDISKEEFAKMKPYDRLMKCLDVYMSSQDPEYKNLSVKEKRDKKFKKIDDIMTNTFGMKEWRKLPDKAKYAHIRDIARYLDMSIVLDIPLSEILQRSQAEKLVLINTYCKKTGQKLEEKDLIVNAILTSGEYDAKSDKDIIEILEEQLKNPSLTKEERGIRLGLIKEMQQAMKYNNERYTLNDLLESKALEDAAAEQGLSVDDYLKYLMKNPQKLRKELSMVLAYAANNDKFDEFTKKLKDAGITDKEIYDQLSAKQIALGAAHQSVKGNVDEFNAIQDIAAKSGKPNLDGVGRKMARFAGYSFKDPEKLTKVQENSINNGYIKETAECNADRNQMTYEQGLAANARLLASQNLTEEQVSEFSEKSIIAFGQNGPKEQKGAYKIAVDSGRPGALEGAAAAESYLFDSIKDECSQYLDDALNSGSYTQEQIDVILKARSTGQTAAERGESYPEGFSTSSSSSSQGSNSTGKSSSSNSTGSSSKTSSSNKASGSGSAGSASSTNAAAKQAQAKAQQAYYEQVTKILEMRKEEALKKLTQMAENYQKSVKAREEKKAKEAQKTAETQKSDSVSKSSSTAKTSSGVQEKKTENEIIEKFASSEEVTSSISQDKREELRQAYQSGGAASLYDKLGSVSVTYQDRFLNYFAEHANTADLCNFASAHSGNKNIILTLYQRSNEPALLRYLGEANMFDLLSKGKIKLQDFLKYASPDMVAKYMLSLKQTGNTGALKEVVSMMSFQQREETSQDFAAQVENKTPATPLPGSDEYNDMLLGNMSKASTQNTTYTASKNQKQQTGGGMLKLDNEDKSTVGDGMLSLNEEDYSGIAMGSNRVRMGLDIKKRDKRFLRMG